MSKVFAISKLVTCRLADQKVVKSNDASDARKDLSLHATINPFHLSIAFRIAH